MPSTLRSGPQALAVTPFFTNEGMLPRTPQDVARNQLEQQRALIEAANISRAACRAANGPYSGPPCMDVLHITLCFDGTNNHEPTDKRNHPPTTSNVARLYHASLGGAPVRSKAGLMRQVSMPITCRVSAPSSWKWVSLNLMPWGWWRPVVVKIASTGA